MTHVEPPGDAPARRRRAVPSRRGVAIALSGYGRPRRASGRVTLLPGSFVRRSKVATAGLSASQADYESSFGTVLDFLRLLWAVEHGLTSISKHMTRTMGVTGQQRVVVKLVGRRPGISAGALAEILHLHPSTLTGILRRLVQRGALVRMRDPADTRRALFRLTPKGREIDRIRGGTVEARVRAALATMSEEHIAVTSSVLDRLARALAPQSREKRQTAPAGATPARVL